MGFGVGRGVDVGRGVAVGGAAVAVGVGGTTSTGAVPQASETIRRTVSDIKKRFWSRFFLFMAILQGCKKLNPGMIRTAIKLHHNRARVPGGR